VIKVVGAMLLSVRWFQKRGYVSKYVQVVKKKKHYKM